jgi:hypothetical protein
MTLEIDVRNKILYLKDMVNVDELVELLSDEQWKDYRISPKCTQKTYWENFPINLQPFYDNQPIPGGNSYDYNDNSRFRVLGPGLPTFSLAEEEIFLINN